MLFHILSVVNILHSSTITLFTLLALPGTLSGLVVAEVTPAADEDSCCFYVSLELLLVGEWFLLPLFPSSVNRCIPCYLLGYLPYLLGY